MGHDVEQQLLRLPQPDEKFWQTFILSSEFCDQTCMINDITLSKTYSPNPEPSADFKYLSAPFLGAQDAEDLQSFVNGTSADEKFYFFIRKVPVGEDGDELRARLDDLTGERTWQRWPGKELPSFAQVACSAMRIPGIKSLRPVTVEVFAGAFAGSQWSLLQPDKYRVLCLSALAHEQCNMNSMSDIQERSEKASLSSMSSSAVHESCNKSSVWVSVSPRIWVPKRRNALLVLVLLRSGPGAEPGFSMEMFFSTRNEGERRSLWTVTVDVGGIEIQATDHLFGGSATSQASSVALVTLPVSSATATAAIASGSLSLVIHCKPRPGPLSSGVLPRPTAFRIESLQGLRQEDLLELSI